jgi:spore coat polysaccharide biosynthesis protein SpsF
MGSKRLPGKALVEIAGEPLLKRLCQRLRHCRRADEVIVATSNEREDDAIFEACRSWGFNIFRGPAQDLTTRLLGAAKAYGFEVFVRVTGDNPLTDPSGIDDLIGRFCESEAPQRGRPAMLHNMHRKGYPYGTGAEVANSALLEFCDRGLHSLQEREHFAQFAKQQPSGIECMRIDAPQEFLRPQYFLTVDYPEDLELQNRIRGRFCGVDDVSLQEVIKFLDNNPTVARMNSHLHQQFPE